MGHCGGSNDDTPEEAKERTQNQVRALAIPGVRCGQCLGRIDAGADEMKRKLHAPWRVVRASVALFRMLVCRPTSDLRGCRPMMIYALTFASGFANEAMAVFWVHNSERGYALRTGLCSAVQALALVVGIGESVHEWRYAPAFVAGYALGATAAVAVKKRGARR